MSNLQSHEQLTPRQTDRREYIIGGASNCLHPSGQREYLGHQGTNAFYQCSRCEAIVIVSDIQGQMLTGERNQECEP
ncbi:hypothetical protein [Haladaptatus halobius]|uniref:hypothetical protein n=1 Tax=Haladaptatus halobius TaxID=2884875 RepID=UPI001D0AC571|nr:hypothetical protein [Haladaptatus halobius]